VLAIAQDAEVKRVFRKKRPTPSEVKDALERVRRLGVLTEVQELAHAYGRQALSALEHLPPSLYYDSLSFFIHQLIDRTS
jgi:geranylgeranyl pyrophosphate synthase